jgi:hypothetical protein
MVELRLGDHAIVYQRAVPADRDDSPHASFIGDCGVGPGNVRVREHDIVAVTVADRDEILVLEPPRLQRKSLGRIQEMDDGSTTGGRLEMIGHLSTFPPGLIEIAHHRSLILSALRLERKRINIELNE